jgi:hypothetical protein
VRTDDILKTDVKKHVHVTPHAVPSFIFETDDDDLHRAVDCNENANIWKSKWDKHQRTDGFFFAGKSFA